MKKMRANLLVLVALSTVLASTGKVLAQSQAPAATSVPPPPPMQSLPRPDFRYKGQVGRTYQDSDPPTFPQVVRAPKGAPNVLLILLDDVGFGQFSVFGGGVPSPNMEKLAARGLRYTRFHTTALCSPTRAALITGRDHHVLPLDWRAVERLSDQLTGRPSLATGRTTFVYNTPLVALPEASAPDLKNKSFTITPEAEVPAGGGDGMILTQGGITAGWGFYLQKGKLVGVHNYIGMERYRVASTENVPTGKVTLTFEFKYDGGGMGKGGMITLLANGRKMAEGRVEKTTGYKYSLYEGQDIGQDSVHLSILRTRRRFHLRASCTKSSSS